MKQQPGAMGMWQFVWLYLQIIVGAVLGALSVVVFLVPADVVPSGISGMAVMLNELFGLPIGILALLLNIPIQFVGARMLPGGWRVLVRTVFAIVIYSVVIDLLTPFVPAQGVSDDRILNALFGGVLGGVGGGFVLRTGASLGGTSTLALIVQKRIGTPLSTTFLYTDTLIIIAAGLVFDVEGALYAMVVLFLGGVAADYIMEGPSVIRTAVVITDHPDEVAQALLSQLGRGVTLLPARGAYTGQQRGMLYVTMARTQVNDLKQVVNKVDPKAFVVIGQAHTAYGEGFRPLTEKQQGSL